MHSIEMVDRNPLYLKSGSVDSRDELHANEPGVIVQLYLVEDLASDEPEIAVDIFGRNLKHRADEVMVSLAHPDSVERVVTPDLVAVDDIGFVPQLPEELQLADVILRVSIGIEDEALPSRRKAATQSSPVAAKSSVSSRATRWARATMLPMVPQSL